MAIPLDFDCIITTSQRHCWPLLTTIRSCLDHKCFGDLISIYHLFAYKRPARRICDLIEFRQGRSAFEPLTETVTAENETQASRRSAENAQETTEPATNTIRQLGSGSYQQQYDRKGYPENSASRALSRQSRRAINDILTTVGVCVGVDADGQIRPVHNGSRAALDNSRVTGIIRENEIGMLVGLTEAALDDLAGACTAGLRYRLQVCR